MPAKLRTALMGLTYTVIVNNNIGYDLFTEHFNVMQPNLVSDQWCYPQEAIKSQLAMIRINAAQGSKFRRR